MFTTTVTETNEGYTKPRSQEKHLDLPGAWQDPTLCSTTYCLLSRATAGSWNLKWSWNVNPGTPTRYVDTQAASTLHPMPTLKCNIFLKQHNIHQNICTLVLQRDFFHSTRSFQEFSCIKDRHNRKVVCLKVIDFALNNSDMV